MTFYRFTILCTIISLLLIMKSYVNKCRVKTSSYDIIPYHANTADWTFPVSYRTVIVLLLLLGAFLRLWRLEDYPAGFHVDEAGMAYDAFCLANYGTDRFLNFHPVYLINYGGGQSAGYAYLCALFFRLFGISLTTMRLPAALAGIGVIWIGSRLSRIMFGQKVSAVTTLLITICPYFITASRVALDCDLLLFCSMLALYLFIRAQETQKNRWYLVSGITFGLCLYTYSLSWIILPVFFVLLFPYLLISRHIRFRQVCLIAVPIFVIALPLFAFLAVNTFDLPAIVTPLFSIPKIPFYRASELKAVNFFNMVETILYIISTDKTNIFSYHSYYTLYMMSIPFLIWGVVLVHRHVSYSMEKGRNEYIDYIFLFFLAALFNAAIQAASNLYRSNCIYFCLALFTAVGLLSTCYYLKYPRFWFCLLIGLYLIQGISFCRFYYSDQVEKENPIVWFTYDYLDDIYAYLHENEIAAPVYIDDYNLTTYCYAMLEYRVSPYDFCAAGNAPDTYDFSYENLHFYLPEDLSEPEEDAIYVVMDYNEEATAALNQSSLSQTHYGYFTIYSSQSAGE